MQSNKFKRRPLSVAVSLAAAAGVAAQQSALAQDDEIALEEVVVTAQKREETLLEAPIAITALDSVQLEDIRAFNL